MEPILVLPLFLFLLFGVIEYTYAYRVKASLNMASAEAVRAGALSNAQLAPIKAALVAGMASEYVKGKDTAVGLVQANARTKVLQAVIDGASENTETVVIISPTADIFDKHKVEQRVRVDGEDEEKEHDVIPNDNLYWRDPKAETVTINGENQGVSIQDANLLKVKTLWCHRLVTPGLDRIVHRLILKPTAMLGGSEAQKTCNAVTQTSLAGNAASGGRIGKGYYLALSSQAIMRMQTPVVNDGTNLR